MHKALFNFCVKGNAVSHWKHIFANATFTMKLSILLATTPVYGDALATRMLGTGSTSYSSLPHSARYMTSMQYIWVIEMKE